MAETTMLYAAVYDSVDAALADMDALQTLHKTDVVGKYDAAVIDKEDGKPHIAKRMDRPRVRLIPELVGQGTLPRKELHEAAAELHDNEAELVVIGEPTVGKAFQKAITRASKTIERSFDEDAEELGRELADAFKE